MLGDKPAQTGLGGIVRSLQRHWRIPDATRFELLADGYSHSNYAFTHDGSDYVLRVPGPTIGDTASELRMLRALPAGLGPPLIAFDVETGRMLTRRVPGPMLADTSPAECHAATDGGRTVSIVDVATWFRSFRRRIPDMHAHYDLESRVRVMLDNPRPEDRRTVSLVNERVRLTRLPGGRVPCHNDLNPWNVIVTGEDPTRWVTLDWESAGLNHPAFDLIAIHAGLELTTPVAEFAARSGVDVSARDLTDLTTWFWIREYAWAAHQLAAGNDRQPIADQLASSAARLLGG